MHHRLRRETQALHARVERASPFGATLDRSSYTRHLARRWGFQAGIAEVLDRWDLEHIELGAHSHLGPDPDPWDLDNLITDLGFLGCTAEVQQSLPICEALPPLGTVAGMLGCVYVLDGARIGGRSVVASVAAVLGLGDHCGGTPGVAFLSGGSTSARARHRFAATLAAIDRHAANLDAEGRATLVASACDTFAALACWLEAGNSEATGAVSSW